MAGMPVHRRIPAPVFPVRFQLDVCQGFLHVNCHHQSNEDSCILSFIQYYLVLNRNNFDFKVFQGRGLKRRIYYTNGYELPVLVATNTLAVTKRKLTLAILCHSKLIIVEDGAQNKSLLF